MLDYVAATCKRFKHDRPKKPQDQPYLHVMPNYGVNMQCADDNDNSKLLNNEDKNFTQEICGNFLYYNRAVDYSILPALGSIALQQAAPTVKQFLDYAATHPDAIITYRD